MRHFILAVLATLLSLSGYAETQIKGKVTDASNDLAVPGANVIVKNSQGKMIGFAATTADGDFSITVAEIPEGSTVNVAVFGYKAYSAPISSVESPLEIRLEDGSLNLKEVVVKSQAIRENGDTITYNVGSFAQRQDRTIGDVLKRMPGIEVSNSGKILYQDKQINKFYIEGSDLLGGKYGIATNGIAHSDVGAVEVMENHQPMQVLRGLSFSDQAAINLKLKDSAKATFVAHGSLGGGWSNQPEGALWMGDIFTMMVAGKYQMITTFKGNNTGHNLSDQLTDFTASKSDERMSRYTSVSSPTTPNLGRKRWYLNRSWMVSSSHLLKTKDGEFKAQVDYQNDRVEAYGNSTTTYFLESGDRILTEDRSSKSHRNALTGKFIYETNQKTLFLNNTLSTDLSWNDITLSTVGSLPNTQEGRTPSFNVENVLKIIKRFRGNRLVTFNSRNEWNSLPERLSVITADGKYGEQISQHSFYTDERASLGFVFGRLLLQLEGGVAGYFRNLDSSIYGIDYPGVGNDGDLSTNYLRIFATPKLEWGYDKLELTLKVPLNLYSYFFSGTMRNRSEFFASPSLSARLKLTPRLSLSVYGSHRRSPASLHSIHDATILSNYRSLSTGVDDYYTSSGQSVGGAVMFRDTHIGLFFSLNGNYGWNKSKFESVQDILGDYIFYSYRRNPSKSRMAYARIMASQSLMFLRGAVGLNGNWTHSNKSLISQNVPTSYSSDAIFLAPFLRGNVSTFMNWNLKFTWERSAMKISDMPERTAQNFIYSGEITLTPCRLITWTIGGEYYRNQLEDGRYKGMPMLDTKLTFNISKRIELTASLSNILNRKEYSYTSFGTVSQTERSSRLRGREFMLSIYLKK